MGYISHVVGSTLEYLEAYVTDMGLYFYVEYAIAPVPSLPNTQVTIHLYIGLEDPKSVA